MKNSQVFWFLVLSIMFIVLTVFCPIVIYTFMTLALIATVIIFILGCVQCTETWGSLNKSDYDFLVWYLSWNYWIHRFNKWINNKNF